MNRRIHKGSKGEFDGCKPDIFAATMDLATVLTRLTSQQQAICRLLTEKDYLD